jgi:hypothetical protein
VSGAATSQCVSADCSHICVETLKILSSLVWLAAVLWLALSVYPGIVGTPANAAAALCSRTIRRIVHAPDTIAGLLRQSRCPPPFCRCPDQTSDVISLQTTFNSTKASTLCPTFYDQITVGVAASANVTGFLQSSNGTLRAQVVTTRYTKNNGVDCYREESAFPVDMVLPANTLQKISPNVRDAALHFTADIDYPCISFSSCKVEDPNTYPPTPCMVADSPLKASISIQLDWDCKGVPRWRDDVKLSFAQTECLPATDVAVCGSTCSVGGLTGSVTFGNLGMIDVSIRDTSKVTVPGNKVRSTYATKPLLP